MIYKNRERLEFEDILRQKYIPQFATSLSPSPRLWVSSRSRLLISEKGAQEEEDVKLFSDKSTQSVLLTKAGKYYAETWKTDQINGSS